MKLQVALELLTLFFAGILVGLEICAHYGFQAPILALEPKSQIRFRQGAVRTLRWIVPAFFVPAAACGIALTFIQGFSAGFIFRAAATVSFLVWIAIRLIGTVPINSASVEWSADDPPRDWSKRLAKAERLHVVGAWAALAAFVCILLSVGTKLST